MLIKISQEILCGKNYIEQVQKIKKSFWLSEILMRNGGAVGVVSTIRKISFFVKDALLCRYNFYNFMFTQIASRILNFNKELRRSAVGGFNIIQPIVYKAGEAGYMGPKENFII